ncbi:pentatricopeptide repeat-containing protein At5g15280, mitochondrial [Malania oleifera]|uniref:pentatricopeptide repeat-containing protein At5g15280, mitochondrial n=1 Tax=Malania oleifera TaxID=397392 RepID=UPI0025AE5F51|nr:pentatricopeptide repeat-containing protein At5g15280, mitochondrial [Malania oleifera]
MRRSTTIIIVLCYRMLQIVYSFRPPRSRIIQVRRLISHFSVPLTKHSFYSSSPTQPSPSSSSRHGSNITPLDLSTIRASGIAKSIISRCSHLWEKKTAEPFDQYNLKDLLFKIFDISPETARRFIRVSELKPEDVLEILLGFQFDCGKPTIEARKVGYLWKIFKWAGSQHGDFKHLPQSCEVMATMLIRVGLLREVEYLLSTMEVRGFSLDSHEIFDNLIRGYVSAAELDRAISIYDRMRVLGLVPSRLCYCVLLDSLVRMNATQLALRVYMDMLERDFELTNAEMATFESVIKLLCRNGRIQEARTVTKKVLHLGLEPSGVVLNEIANGYCRKNDFEDLLSFYTEMSGTPDGLAGNRFVFYLCSNFGTERADKFMRELEHLGFCPDAATYGILIGWSCCEGRMKNAFIYLSEILSRCLIPDISSYNALISGLFKKGMWKHAQDILHEMVDKGISPNLSTFRVLLAGYCKTRQFDEAKGVVQQMVNCGLIQSSSMEDPLSNAFLILGFNPLAVRVKRDNDVGFFKKEFYDDLGNGLYLETDLDEYEKTLASVLEDSMVLDFNSLVVKECGDGNLKTALAMVDVMILWGQELSLLAFSVLVKRLCESHRYMMKIISLVEKMPESIDQLDQETLNLVVQAHSRKGFLYKGRIILDRMFQRHLIIKSETYTALIMGFCKEADWKGLLDCWDLARKDSWVPELKGCRLLVGSLCQLEMLKEAVELFETMLVSYPHLRSDICDVFLEKLCVTGNTSIAHVLVEELLRQGCMLDVTVYSHLMRGFCEENRLSEAFMIYNVVLSKQQAPCLDFEKSIEMKETCLRVRSSISISVHAALISGFCKAGKVGEAVNLFHDMLEGLATNGKTLNALVQGHCRENNLREVGELLGAMMRKNLSVSVSSYRKLVQLMCIEGKFLQALTLKELMLREGNYPCIIIYNILIFHLLTAGNDSLVCTLLNELQGKGLLPNEVTYNFLIYGFSKCKDMSSSMQYMTTMISKGFKPSSRSLKIVICHLLDAGDIEGALELSRSMELRGCFHGSVVQNAIIECLLSCGKLKEAENFLDCVTEMGLIPSNINYDNLIKRFCCCGRLAKAIDLLNIMLKKGSIPSPISYDYLIQGFCSNKKLDQAADFHAEVLERNLKPSIHTWNMLVDKFCEEGLTSEAEKLLATMVQIGETPTRGMYHSAINRYRLENNSRKAAELLQAMQQNGYEPDFETHWSLISTLFNSKDKDNSNSAQGFLSKLLAGSGFGWRKDINKVRKG